MGLAFHGRPAAAQEPYYGGPAYPPAPPRTTGLEFPQDDSYGIVQVSAQGDKKGGKDQDQVPAKQEYLNLEFRNLREIPSLEVLTRLESQAALFERMRQESLRSGERIIFPEEPVLSKVPYPGRHWPEMAKLVEPNFLVHGRLLFEQQNLERGLWEFGVLTPVLSTGKFYWDVLALPYHAATRPCQQYDTSAGKCLPGDPTPFFLYPPEFSVTGLAAEAAVITSGFFIFP